MRCSAAWISPGPIHPAAPFALLRIVMLLAIVACSDSPSEPVNTTPVAVVGPITNPVRGDTVVLDGTSSHDADGDSLTFAWTLVSAPTGSSAAILPSDGASPALIVDLVGTYVVSLIVNDGRKSSAPESATMTSTLPVPTVRITAPADLEVVTSSPVTVTGDVDDPASTVTVNGVTATVNALSGAYSATVPLQPGNNTITSEAVNGAGSGTAAIAVILNTADAPVVIVKTPANNFLVGRAYLGGQLPVSEAVQVRGVIHVFTTEVVNTPTVTVSGVPAAVGDTTFAGCSATPPKQCFKYSASIALALGRHTLEVIGTDVLGGADTASVTGASDVGYFPSDADWQAENKKASPVPWSGPTPLAAALTQTDPLHPHQNNRAHEVDGCSVPVVELDGTWRNDPMHAATQNKASTEFGSGSRPPADHFIHGKKPVRGLPCNNHDVCYQTVGSSRATCDSNFYAEMRAVCTKAYPTISQPLLHPVYTSEQKKCYDWARAYYDGVNSRGQPKFDARQAQFAWP